MSKCRPICRHNFTNFARAKSLAFFPAKIYDDSILVTKTPLDYIHHEQRGFIWLEFMRQFSRVGFHTTCQITPSLIQLFFFLSGYAHIMTFPFCISSFTFVAHSCSFVLIAIADRFRHS